MSHSQQRGRGGDFNNSRSRHGGANGGFRNDHGGSVNDQGGGNGAIRGNQGGGRSSNSNGYGGIGNDQVGGPVNYQGGGVDPAPWSTPHQYVGRGGGDGRNGGFRHDHGGDSVNDQGGRGAVRGNQGNGYGGSVNNQGGGAGHVPWTTPHQYAGRGGGRHGGFRYDHGGSVHNQGGGSSVQGRRSNAEGGGDAGPAPPQHASRGGGGGRGDPSRYGGGGAVRGSRSNGYGGSVNYQGGGSDSVPWNTPHEYASRANQPGQGGGDRGGSSSYHPHGDRHRDTPNITVSSIIRSKPDLHQANQPSHQVPQSTTWEKGSTSSTMKSNSSDITDLCRELSIQSTNSPTFQFPLRPNFGRRGSPCRLTTHHFLMTLHSSLTDIHHYNVTIQPEIRVKTLNRSVMEQLAKSYKQSHLGNMLLAYDGESSFYTAKSLPFTSKEFQVSVPSEGGANKQFVVAISLVSVIDLQKIRDFIGGKHDESAQEAIQAFDVVFRQTPTSKFVPVKRSFHSSENKSDIGGGIEAWSGFYQSVRPTQNGLSLVIDTSAAAFVKNLKVTNFVEEVLNIRKLPRTPLSDAERLKVKRALKGLKVEVAHRKSGRRYYTISGVTKEPTKEISFPFGDSGEVKFVAQYFYETYGIVLEYPSLPCLQVGGGKGILLPMEVCEIVGGQRYIKRLDEKQTAFMVSLNSQTPRDREADILEMVRQNDYAKDRYIQEFGINMSETASSVQARILPSPQLNYNGTPFQPRSGQWNMINQKMYVGGTVSSWSCLNFAVADGLANTFCEKLASFCITHGMNYNPIPILPPRWNRAQLVEQALVTLQKDATARLGGRQLDLLIVLLPDNNGSLYGEVKRICETKLGIVSQCVLAKTVKSMNPHSLANIVLKINAKVGGINVVLKDDLPMVTDKPTIIFGADVTHPSPGDDLNPSIAAVVASQNWPKVTKYTPILSAQGRGKEMIQDLERMIKEHFRSFVKNNNKQRPERIIFYRDGVSEGQFNQVLKDELKAIQKAWVDEFHGCVVPPITFVVVQKRHHTKLFPSNDSKSVDTSGNGFPANSRERKSFPGKTGASQNILPGTVVDTDICHPSQFDFYLCSHAGIKGTSRSAHYHVLWDDNKFTADQLQTLTNNLCYIYARCTRAVSYVSPAYYAHLAAFRARFYLGDESLSDENSVRGDAAVVKQLPSLCDNLKNLPFYC
ncbi:hypothetical protein ACHQM5_005298 [Ranunculus cassubicifolius]